MSIAKAIMYTQQSDSFEAGKEAMEEVLGKMGELPDFLLMFATVGHDIPEVVRGIRESGGDIPLCGCSGEGVITHLGCDEAAHSVGLAGLKSEKIRFDPFIFKGLSSNPAGIGKMIGEKAKSLRSAESDKQLIFIFPDGLTVNADDLVKGIRQGAGFHIDCAGGNAGNDWHLTKTYQFCNSEISNDAVSGVVISGNFNYKISVSHGSRPIGMFRTITRSEGNVVYEIDNQPALEFITKLVGQENADFGQVTVLISLGVSFEGKDYAEDTIIRAILGIDEARKSIQLGAPLPAGTRIRMTWRDQAKVLTKTRQMAVEVLKEMRVPDHAVYFYFNCAGRGSCLFGDPEPDVAGVIETLGSRKDIVGFWTFGEIAPVSGKNFFHNYTGVLVGIE